MKKSKLIILIIGVLVLIAGITYAAYSFAVSTKITGVSECFKINYNKGSDIGSDSNSRTLMLSEDYTGGLFASVIVGLDKKCTINNGKGTLYLNTDSSTSSALLSSGALKYQVVENGIVSSVKGTITSTGKIAIYSNIPITTSSKQISVSVWIDSNELTESNAEAVFTSKYKGSISMKVESGD